MGHGSLMTVAILATDLAELAGPVGHDTGKTIVRQAGVGSAAAAIEAAAHGPATIDAVFAGGIQAEGVLGLENIEGRELIASAAEELGAEKERMIDGAAERLPTEGRIRAVQIGEKTGRIERCADARSVVAASVRSTKIEVGRFAEVAVDAKMANSADILAPVGGKDIAGVTAVNLGGALDEPVFRGGQEPRKGDAGIVDAVFAADEVVGREGPVDERQSVIVNSVDLAEFGAHLADFKKEPGRKRCECNVAFLDVYAGFAE